MPKLTRKVTKIAGITAVAVLGIGAGALIGQPILNEVNTNNQAAEDATNLIQQANLAKAELELAQANYPEVVVIEEQMLTLFPEQAEIQSLLNSVNDTLLQAGLPAQNLTSITFSNPTIVVPEVAPAAPADAPAEGEAAADPAAAAPASGTPDTTASGGTFATFEVGASIIGTPAQLEVVLQGLNNMDRALIIDSFGTTIDTDGVATLSFTGTAFVYSEIETPEEALTPEEGVPGEGADEQGTTGPENAGEEEVAEAPEIGAP